jgi:uncharacterized protein YndB with AHSA1/START domain
MRPISASISIDAPREHVFEFLCDLANRPAFSDHFMREFRLERLESSGIGAAARFKVNPPPGKAMWLETVIEGVEPAYRIYEHGRGGRSDRIPVSTSWELTEGPGETTDVTLTHSTEPSNPVDRIREGLGARRWWRRRWARALRHLKQALESDRPVERVHVGGGDRVPIT